MRTPPDRAWVEDALGRLEADQHRSSDTHLIPVPLPCAPDIDVYLKDESTHPTGSLKHRLARSLFLYALCNGWIGPGTPVIEASSGSTAVSEAYFARLLGLPFVAVMPATTTPEKIRRIERTGGTCHFVEHAKDDRAEAARLAKEMGGHFMDQFTYAERATDWRGNNNIAESLFEQLERERHPVPEWIVCGAGTGGTSATLGRWIRYKRHSTKLCVADPEHSVFHRWWRDGTPGPALDGGSGIEGIGRPRAEPSFLPELVDDMVVVPNPLSIAVAHRLEDLLGRRVGASTGTLFTAVCVQVARMRAAGKCGSVVSLICDSGELYRDTYDNPAWLTEKGIDLRSGLETIDRFLDTGESPLP